jgi:jumonji domain-containing protein 2
MFAWHTEDMDLFSINFLHFGEPKYWYSVPPHAAHQMEALAKTLFPSQFRSCPEFLRHKTTLISPLVLQAHNIPIFKMVQNRGTFYCNLLYQNNSSEGEFMITFPRAYHCGFNGGMNCAESVNFALESWMSSGSKGNI